MRVLILLATVACCYASFRDFFVHKVQEGGKDRLDSLNADDRDQLLKSFSRTNMSMVHGKLQKLRKKWNNKLKLDNQTQQELGRRMQSYRRKDRNVVRSQGDTLHEVNAKANLTEFMYQGDIVLTEDQIDAISADPKTDNRARRQAYRDRAYPSTIWGSTVFYYFDGTATTSIRNAFTKAAQFWQANTCINFQESTTAANRIRVFKGQGCYSYIGMIRGVQELSLGNGCDSVGTAAHEIGHALGFFHTQSRFDRDNSITVNINNIQPSFVDQFDKETSSTNYNYGMPYDYGSVMQYGGLSASSNNQPTMVARDIKYQDTMGSDMVGFYDISMINEHYMCKGKCGAAGAACANGGFPNPRSCGVCICPSGYGGTLCNQRPAGCGSILTPNANFQTLQDQIGDGTQNMAADFTKCNYWIQAPAGSRVEVRLKSFSGYFTDGCIYGGVEIKTHADQKLTGYRLCSNSDAGTSFVSTSNIVPVITFNRYARSTVQVEYRITGSAAPAPGPAPAPSPSTNCVDTNTNCANFIRNGFCSNTFYTIDQRRATCGRSCSLC